MNDINERLARIEERLEHVAATQVEIRDSIHELADKCGSYESRIAPIETKVAGIMWLFGVIGTAIIGLFIKGCV